MWQAGHFMIYNWVLLGISLLTVLVRLYVDFKGVRKVSIYRDILLVLIWLIFLAITITNQVLCHHHLWNPDAAPFLALPVSTMISIAKLNWAQAFLVLPVVYLCKIDLLFLYHTLSPRHLNPKMFWGIIAAWVCTIGGLLCQIIYLFVLCIPVSLMWQEPDEPSCKYSFKYFYAVWFCHIISDVVVYVVPLVIIFRMQKMTSGQKWSAAAMFLVGFINIMTSTICMAGMWLINVSQGNFALYGAAVHLTMAQIATAIWIICMPHMRSIWQMYYARARHAAGEGKAGAGENHGYHGSDGTPQPAANEGRKGPQVSAEPRDQSSENSTYC